MESIILFLYYFEPLFIVQFIVICYALFGNPFNFSILGFTFNVQPHMSFLLLQLSSIFFTTFGFAVDYLTVVFVLVFLTAQQIFFFGIIYARDEELDSAERYFCYSSTMPGFAILYYDVAKGCVPGEDFYEAEYTAASGYYKRSVCQLGGWKSSAVACDNYIFDLDFLFFIMGSLAVFTVCMYFFIFFNKDNDSRFWRRFKSQLLRYTTIYLCPLLSYLLFLFTVMIPALPYSNKIYSFAIYDWLLPSSCFSVIGSFPSFYVFCLFLLYPTLFILLIIIPYFIYREAKKW
jgi:hypothetical protein